MSRPRTRVIGQNDRAFLLALISALDRVSLEDYVVGVEGAIAQLADFAKGYWTGQSKGLLWDASAPVWRRIRESITPADDHSHRTRWSVPVRTTIEDMAFLAAIATRDYDASTKTTARSQLAALINATIKEGSADNRALQFLASLILRTRILEQESPTKWAFDEEFVTSEMSTLTARAFSGPGRSFFEEERDRTIVPSLRAYVIERAGVAEIELLKRLDAAQHLQEQDEILYALQVIGGCRASQELCSRLAAAEPDLQCAILAVLEKLAGRVYRPGTSDKEQPVSQLETADTVLRGLGELIVKPTPERVRQLVKSVNEAVTAHRTQCFNSHR